MKGSRPALYRSVRSGFQTSRYRCARLKLPAIALAGLFALMLAAAVWAVETASVTGLARQGITEETVKPGDTVSMRCHQLRDGSNGCLLGWLTSPDGIEREWD